MASVKKSMWEWMFCLEPSDPLSLVQVRYENVHKEYNKLRKSGTEPNKPRVADHLVEIDGKKEPRYKLWDGTFTSWNGHVGPLKHLVGFQDTKVRDQLWRAQAMEKAGVFDQFQTFACWYTPVACNAFCLPCYDCTHLEQRMNDGTAYNMVCGPLCGSPELLEKSDTTLRWGTEDELVIIASCAGDHHGYYTVEQYNDLKKQVEAEAKAMGLNKADAKVHKEIDSYVRNKLSFHKKKTFKQFWDKAPVADEDDGLPIAHAARDSVYAELGVSPDPNPKFKRAAKVHTLFDKLAAVSEGRIIHTPIMMLSRDARIDPEGYYKKLSIQEDTRADEVTSDMGGEADVWIGYWAGNVREAISQAANRYGIKKIKVVALYGGGPASSGERARLASFGAMNSGQKTAKESMACAFQTGMCCMTCGGSVCAQLCCPGCRSGVYMAEATVLRFMLCADPRDVELEFMTVDSSQLVDYLDQECKDVTGLTRVVEDHGVKANTCGCGAQDMDVKVVTKAHLTKAVEPPAEQAMKKDPPHKVPSGNQVVPLPLEAEDV